MILSGIRVIDLIHLLPGPFATEWLIAMGAEVIRVELPIGGTGSGRCPLSTEELGEWLFAVNRGKKSVAIDLKGPAASGFEVPP
ncbi:MAG: CoA transferase [Anaerolineae bacterium]|nr:CoA transferase [Thermoflexus sp.]MDW8064383.1 CoA transferase [Anaerolineae bacterium]